MSDVKSCLTILRCFFRWSSDENKEPCVATGKRAVKVANYYCLKRSDRNECRIQFRDAQPHNAGLWKLTITRRFPYGEYSLKIRYVQGDTSC